MRLLRNLSLAAGLAASSLGAVAQTQPAVGPYLVLAAGRAQYDYNCWYWSACDSASATMGKIGGGYRFGVWALEGWYFDMGKGTVRQGNQLRLQGGAVTGAWYLPLSAQIEGLLRAGLADVRQSRTGDASRSRLAGIVGLGLDIKPAPAVAVELGLDVTGGEGRRSGTTTGTAFSVGLRVGF